MQFGIYLPPFADFADPARVARLAERAEAAGWDGLFLWDHMLSDPGTRVADPWVTMAAIASRTARLRFGALVTPLVRRRPWVLARQMATLDQLSGGRLIGGVGLGDDGWREFSAFGEVLDPAKRGQALDEALDVLCGLLTGEPFSLQGQHYTVDTPALLPAPRQKPLPLWGACVWPNRKPLARAARLQGCFPIFPTPIPPSPPTVAEVTEVRRVLAELGASPDSDLVVRYALSLQDSDAAGQTSRTLAEAGVTWILDSFGPGEPPSEAVEEIVDAGPPT